MNTHRTFVAAIALVCAIGGWILADSHRVLGQAGGSSEIITLPDNFNVPDVKPNRKYKIGVLFPFLAAPFWVNEAYGVLDQAQKFGLEVNWLSADGYTNIDKQNSQIEDLITLRVDAILLAATSFSGTVPAVERAASAGIPVFTHVTSSNTPVIKAAVLTDDLAIGRKQAEFMGAALGGRGEVAMLSGPAAAEWSMKRAQGFKEIMAQKFPNIKIVAERFGIPDRADPQRLTQDLLVTFPQLNGIFTVADGMALGAADAARAVNRIEKMTITTASFSREAVPYIQAGYIKLDIDESPVITGRMVVNRSVEFLNGQTVPKLTYVPIPGWTKESLKTVDSAHHWAPESWKIR